MLSPPSVLHAYKQLQAEVELLMMVHHKNLTIAMMAQIGDLSMNSWLMET
ncbi:hypothetical protein ACOSP7_020278 [Xanthoceras sorbifolium]